MPFDIEVMGQDELLQRLSDRRAQLPGILKQTMAEQMGRVANSVRRKLNNDVLHIRTGNLINSVFSTADATDENITGVVGTGVQAPYAGIHEHGADFDRMVRMAWGREMKNPHTVHFHYPQRAFLRPSLDENRQAVFAALRGSVAEALSS